jgi:hypothetical protein
VLEMMSHWRSQVGRNLKEERLPAKLFGGSLMIEEKDLRLVADRRPGRTKKQGSTKEKKV